MEKEKKSFFDLSEKEQEKVKKEMKEKTKYWVKRILIGFLCVVLILCMVFKKFSDTVFFSSKDST